jgi:hypothetical protein
MPVKLTLAITIFLLAVTLAAKPLEAQTASAQSGSQSTAAAPTFTNDDVIKLVQAQFSEATVLGKIKSSNCDFDTSTDALIKLKRDGVSEPVLQAMMDAMTPAAPPPAAASPADDPQPANSSSADCADYSSCVQAGALAIQSAQWDQALASLQKASSLDPTKAVPWGYIGAVYLATGQYDQVPAAGNKNLSLGGPLNLRVCHLKAFQPCEQGKFVLGLKEISFVGPNGQKLFAVAPSQIVVKGVVNDPALAHAYFSIQAEGKNYRFDYIPVGVTCNILGLVQCPQPGIDQQLAVANYVVQTIPRLASGDLGSSPP